MQAAGAGDALISGVKLEDTWGWGIPRCRLPVFSLSLEFTKLLSERPLESCPRILQAMNLDIKSESVFHLLNPLAKYKEF